MLYSDSSPQNGRPGDKARILRDRDRHGITDATPSRG